MITTDTRTLVVYPIAPYGSPRSEDEVALYGHCAAFCTLEGPTHGQTIGEHGPWCTSIFAGHASAVDDQGRAVEAYLELAEHYLHGVYRREDARRGVNRNRFSFTSGEIRRLAAALIHAADAADMLDGDLNDGKARREAREDEE